MYEKLKKIKRPVMLYVRDLDGNRDCDKVRILFPDGSCIYSFIVTGDFGSFETSCFNYIFLRHTKVFKRKKIFKDLAHAIDLMQEYDEFEGYEVTEIFEC